MKERKDGKKNNPHLLNPGCGHFSFLSPFTNEENSKLLPDPSRLALLPNPGSGWKWTRQDRLNRMGRSNLLSLYSPTEVELGEVPTGGHFPLSEQEACVPTLCCFERPLGLKPVRTEFPGISSAPSHELMLSLEPGGCVSWRISGPQIRACYLKGPTTLLECFPSSCGLSQRRQINRC